MVSRTNAILLRTVPTLALAGLAAYAVFGPSGVYEERQLARKAEDAKEAWLAVDRENDNLVFELQRLGKDPIEVERAVADELALARPGAKLYRFDGDELTHAEPAIAPASTEP